MGKYGSGMVVAAQPEAVEAGVDTLRAGGNAVDAAVACALVAGVVDPQMCGIAGFGSAQFFLPGASDGGAPLHTCVDFHGIRFHLRSDGECPLKRFCEADRLHADFE